MQSQPFLDAMLGIDPSHSASNSFGILLTSPDASSSTYHDLVEGLRYGGSSTFPHGTRRHPYHDASPLPVDLSEYEMLQLLTPVAPTRSPCRCGGSESTSYPTATGASAGLGMQRSQYPSYAQQPIESSSFSHFHGPVSNVYSSMHQPSSKTKPPSLPFIPSDYPSSPSMQFDGLDSWEAMNAELLSTMNFVPPADLPNFLPSSPYYQTSPDTSPSPSASPRSDNSEYFNHQLEPSVDSRHFQPSAAQSPPVKQCSHCRATSTPLWRREPTTLKPLCNACGLYLQQRNKLRPQELIDADDDDDASDAPGDLTGPECSHCHTRQTSVWRRSKTGAQLCNACGVYSRLRGKDRPLSLKRNKIKPRSKHPSAK